MVVVDASVVADALIDPAERGRAARQILNDQPAVAPAIVDAEYCPACVVDYRQESSLLS
ncbi:MAG: hypothetical protein ACRDPW_00425 [Mycobacteriales bacterium]